MDSQPKDHDILIRLDEKVNNLIEEVKGFTTVTMAFDARVRKIEDDVQKIQPIIPYSQAKLAQDLISVVKRVDTLEKQSTSLSGGWRGVALVGGSIMLIVNFLWGLSNIFHWHL